MSWEFPDGSGVSMLVDPSELPANPWEGKGSWECVRPGEKRENSPCLFYLEILLLKK